MGEELRRKDQAGTQERLGVIGGARVPVRRGVRIRRELCGVCSGGSVAAHRSA